jgi:serine/threonine protein kinase
VPKPIILVVDDDDTTREYVALCLSTGNYRVETAANGVEGFKKAKALLPAMVISDIRMPQLDGFGMVSAIKAHPALADIPVLLMSSQEDRASYRRAFGLGVADFLVKPVDRRDLLSTVGDRLAALQAAKGASPAFPDIPGYRVVRHLGAGGMSDVYLAYRHATGEECALKTIRVNAEAPEAKEMVARFLDEYVFLAWIEHPGVARVIDHGVSGRVLFTVMEYFPGGDLRALMREQMSVSRVLSQMREIAAGLNAIHEKGMVHRDLKPGNIMLRADGSLAIADFGLAKIADVALDITRGDVAMGTPYYMSPEQINGDALDARADLYSLGVMFYEMLTGKRMFEAESVDALLAKHLKAPRPQLPLEHPAVTLQPLLEQLFAIDRDRRLNSVAELIVILDAALTFNYGTATDLERTQQNNVIG